jgi:hypothetical protein
MKGKTVTLKLMIRREDAPKETAKFMGKKFPIYDSPSYRYTKCNFQVQGVFTPHFESEELSLFSVIFLYSRHEKSLRTCYFGYFSGFNSLQHKSVFYRHCNLV